MYDIFCKASSVLAWLGVPSIEHTPLLNLLVAYPTDAGPWPAIESRIHKGNCKLHELCEIEDSFLADTKWFSRQWVRQEVHAARDLQMFSGPYKFHFRTLELVSEYLIRSGREMRSLPGPPDLHVAFSRYHILNSDYLRLGPSAYLRRPASKVGPPSPSEVWTKLLFESAFFDSSLPHDKIYALIGMAKASIPTSRLSKHRLDFSSKEESDLRVDYTKPLPLVYRDVFEMLYRLSSSSQILLSFRACHRVVIDDVPSWFPDLESTPPGISWFEYHKQGGINIEDYDSEEGSITISGHILTQVTSENASRHQLSFEQAMAEGFPDENDALWAERLQFYGYQKSMKSLHCLSTACRRLFKTCSFSLVSLQKRDLTARRGDELLHPPDYDLVALAPRGSQAGDVVVEQEGSLAKILLRPSARKKGKFVFLSPIIPFLITSIVGFSGKQEERKSWTVAWCESSLQEFRMSFPMGPQQKFCIC